MSEWVGGRAQLDGLFPGQAGYYDVSALPTGSTELWCLVQES